MFSADVYSIKRHVITYVSDLWKVHSLLSLDILLFPHSTDHNDIIENLLTEEFNTNNVNSSLCATSLCWFRWVHSYQWDCQQFISLLRMSTIHITTENINHFYHQWNCQSFLSPVRLSTIHITTENINHFITSQIVNHSYHQWNYQPFLSPVWLSTIPITSEIINHSYHQWNYHSFHQWKYQPLLSPVKL